MVVKVSDMKSLGVFKSEDNLPVAENRYRSKALVSPLQAVQIKSRQVHIMRTQAGVKSGQY
jgi:hypothetical protein